MWVGVLGAMEVRDTAGDPIAVGGTQVRALLAMLAFDAGRVVTAERLIDGLYGEEPPGNAANALQSQVSRLRRLLGRGGAVEFHPAGYRLAVRPEDVDAHRFERLALEGRRALAAGDRPRAVTLLREALALWRGPALPDAGDAPSVRAQATRLEEMRLAVVEERVEAELAAGAHRTLVAELRDLVAAHPLREGLRGQLIRALYGSGRQAEALAAYEEARRTLAEELGAEPTAELAATHLAVLRGEPFPTAPAAPQPDAPAVRQALPAQLTSFVGREREMARVAALLEEGRLVTLTGPGGAGKTRLAVEAAARQPGEVYFADLAPLGEGDEVAQAVFGVLGLRESGLTPVPDRPPADSVERMIAALAGRQVLLVLDNCEHLVEAAAGLAGRLLGACPRLRVLATSREALGITGESLCPLPSLAVPPPGTPAPQTLGYPAVRLFADRAVAVLPGFTVDGASVEAVLRICRALDGQPLAIELAAARLRSLPVAEVAARLDDRFRLLSRGSRTAQPRHRTLRAVVEWSWELLDETERTLARRLTVFSGGAGLEAIAAVCGLPDDEVVELLTGLVDKSLIEVSGARYRMLNTIRAFCAERLAEAGEVERFRRSHADHFLDLLLAAEPRLLTAGQLEWLASLDAERDNLHVALRRAVDTLDVERGLRLLAPLTLYWWLRGLRTEGATRAQELIRAIGTRPPDGLEEEYALCVLSIVPGGSHSEFGVHLENAVEAMVGSGRPLRRPFLTMMWGMVAGIPDEASPGLAEHRRRLLGADPWSQALRLVGEGLMRLYAGRMDEAERDLAAGLAGFRAIGERWGLALTLGELVKLAEWRGDSARASALCDEALELARELGADEDIAERLCQRAGVRTGVGDLEGARRDAERAAVLARRTGASEILARADQMLGRVARLRGEPGEARRLSEAALAECPAGWFGAEESRTHIMIELGLTAEAGGDAPTALAWYRRALAVASSQRNMTTVALVTEMLSGVALLEDDGERAALLLGAGTAVRGTAVAGDADVARLKTAAREALGDEGYEKAYGRGVSLTREEALALAGAPVA
ncbi:BTAD domain-containing putative transcriptional regulator [Streptosporangium roseum]|uniref:Protein kinase n=1 Tax=Streptosporangium roseum (strain ATCC 12428 / DSM 43021 / JCM 3005 / KCTC 9067 / NCIMB 10171 / NRRL 2505 / NI 9100) TaxID=479432 RepID=D2BCB7_STRRD|nr:BTAD domain-containing putative transcriptional regulator [Streptosporangium roseum]ACZ89946.1 protein kinase [Streptosporangium roseum DSM 43021]